jgi:hypothetical protein
MDFVEKLFHVSPDAGNGSYEILLTVLLGFLILAGVLFAYLRGRASQKKNNLRERRGNQDLHQLFRGSPRLA